MEKDLYKILGITDEEKNLSGEEWKKLVNKKFRKLSLKYHPDKHVNDSEEEKKKAEEKFKEISAANDVLSDENKRRQYDMGENPFGENSPWSEFFKRGGFGGFGGGFEDFFGETKHEKINRGSDILVTLNLTMEEAYRGGKFKVNFYRQEECTHCNGTGNEDGKVHKCHHCNGTGMFMETKQTAFGIMQSMHPCQYCHGTGKEVTKKCHHCNGTGLGQKNLVSEYVTIPSGVDTGMQMSINGKGNKPIGCDGIPGNLIVRFNVENDDYFERVDSVNVVHREKVNFIDCLLGLKKEFKCLDGTTVEVKTDNCIESGKAFIFKGKGFPTPNSPTYKGDYAVVIEYNIPQKLNDKQRQELNKIKNFF